MDAAPDPDWYHDNVLVHGAPGALQSPVMRLPAARWRAWWHARYAALDPRLVTHTRGFVLRRAELGDLGIGDAERRRHLRDGAWSVPARGVVAVVRVPAADDDPRGSRARREHALRAAASVLLRPGQVASGRRAAVMHGLPTFSVPDRAELNAEPTTTAGRHGSPIIRTGALAEPGVSSWFGTPVTTVARTLADLGRHDARDAIMATDAALREGLVSLAELETALEQARGWPGVRRGRDVLRLADPSAESPLESMLRLALHDDGFPEPVLQWVVGPYRADLAWPAARLVLEADGRGKNTERERWREKRRDLYLARLGYRVERVTWEDVVLDWPATSAYLRRVLAARLPPRSDRKWS